MATPERFNARRVITDAYQDIGVLGIDGVPDAAQGQDGLRRLNRLIAQLKTQEFSFPFVSRQVFPVTASQSTYTVGPGGDFNTQRPQSLDGAGLLLQPLTASFPITTVSQTVGAFVVAGDQTGSFPSGSDFIVSGSTGNDGSYTIVSAVYDSPLVVTIDLSTVILVAETIVSPVADGTAQVFGEGTATTEIPIGLLTDDAYQAIQTKGLTNSQFTQAYYNPTYFRNLGTLLLWPKPTTAVNAIVLYVNQQIDGFADLDTEYCFPPGYADLFEYGLAQRMAPPNGIGDPAVLQQIQMLFVSASTLVKRQNVKLNDMPTDAMTSRGGIYNILTNTT